jgi:hypothetical protein
MPAEPAFGATCRYVPGPGGAVISAGFWMLSDVDPSDGWISAVWDSLSLLDLDTAEEQCTSLPERLVGTSVAIALVQPSGLRLHLVGGATIEVTTEDDSQAIVRHSWAQSVPRCLGRFGRFASCWARWRILVSRCPSVAA